MSANAERDERIKALTKLFLVTGPTDDEMIFEVFLEDTAQSIPSTPIFIESCQRIRRSWSSQDNHYGGKPTPSDIIKCARGVIADLREASERQERADREAHLAERAITPDEARLRLADMDAKPVPTGAIEHIADQMLRAAYQNVILRAGQTLQLPEHTSKSEMKRLAIQSQHSTGNDEGVEDAEPQ